VSSLERGDPSLDERVSSRLALPPTSPALRSLALLLAHSGDSLLWLLVAAIVFIVGGPSGRDFALRVLAATTGAGLAATALKWLFRRDRPPAEGRGFYTRFDRPSFPSGHAARTSCLAVLAAPLLPARSWPLPALWVALVGLARVSLQVHFVADIAAGWMLGLLIGGALLLAF
jgi:membrane-associated phospholipid phosphatase